MTLDVGILLERFFALAYDGAALVILVRAFRHRGFRMGFVRSLTIFFGGGSAIITLDVVARALDILGCLMLVVATVIEARPERRPMPPGGSS